MWLRAMLVWLLLLLLAIANGALREMWLAPATGTRSAHVLSTISLSVLILLATRLTAAFVRYRSPRAAWRVGALWVVMTLDFEFLAGHYASGKPWVVRLAGYDLAQGRIWPLDLLVTLAAPRVAAGPRESTGQADGKPGCKIGAWDRHS